MSLTASINTPERDGKSFGVPVAAGAKLFAGNLVARDAAGNLVAAANTAGLVALGRLEESVDNTGGAAGAVWGTVKRGTFRFKNSATSILTKAHVGTVAFVENEETVALAASNSIKAGLVLEVSTDGVWIDTHRAY